MNAATGQLLSQKDYEALSSQEKVNYIPVNRDLSVKEQFTKQIELYAPCGCGSGKKFKFCCKK